MATSASHEIECWAIVGRNFHDKACLWRVGNSPNCGNESSQKLPISDHWGVSSNKETNMITYEIHRGFLLKLADPGIPFLSFDKFFNIAKTYRDEFFACQHIEGFLWEVGVKYNVWTYDLHAKYHRHVFFDEIKKPIKISFDIPHLTKDTRVPLNITIFDDEGVIFTMNQVLVFDVLKNGEWKISPWRKIEPIKNCVLSLCSGTSN